MWKDYQIPIIKLSEKLSLEDVAKVFEKLNSTGIVLTTFDLLNARLLKFGISLRTDLWKKTKEDFTEILTFSERNERFPTYILQTMALTRKSTDGEGKIHVSAKTKDLLNLSPENFQKDWWIACQCIEEAIKRLKSMRSEDGFGVISPKFMPYFTMIPPFAALLHEANSKRDKGAALSKIKKWYWASLIAKRYSSSTDSTMSSDFRDMITWIDEDTKIPKFVQDSVNAIERLDFSEISKFTDALYKGILCLLAIKGGRDFVNNDTVNFSNLDDHHIFPESRAKEFGVSFSGIQTILNKTLISRETNRNYIKDKKPSLYVKKIRKDQPTLSDDDFIKRMETHLINRDAINALMEDDYDRFISLRKSKIKEVLISLFE